MDWKTIELQNIKFAMEECDNIGLDRFREKYGFHPAHNIHMFFDRRGPYEARPLIAAAYSNKYPHQKNLVPPDFEHDNAHKFLEQNFQFKKKPIRT